MLYGLLTVLVLQFPPIIKYPFSSYVSSISISIVSSISQLYSMIILHLFLLYSKITSIAPLLNSLTFDPLNSLLVAGINSLLTLLLLLSFVADIQLHSYLFDNLFLNFSYLSTHCLRQSYHRIFPGSPTSTENMQV